MQNNSIVDHLEKYLGEFIGGYRNPDPTRGAAIQVVTFQNQPWDGGTTYVTLGLSNHLLKDIDGNAYSEELVFATYQHYKKEDIASFLLTFAEYLLSQHHAVLRGEYVGPSDPIIAGTSLIAVYATVPVFYDEAFRQYDGSTPPTVLVWLVPIHAAEAQYINVNGWDAFETMLENSDPDLLDLQRRSLVE